MGQFIRTITPPDPIVYTATGTEGNKVYLPQLIGRTIDLVTYNTLVLIPEIPPLDQQGYYYDSTPGTADYGYLVLGIPLNADDVLQILYT